MTLIIEGKLEFHGQTKNINVSSNLIEDDNSIQIEGSFHIKPTDYFIKLPSFMLAEIQDLLKIKFDLYFLK